MYFCLLCHFGSGVVIRQHEKYRFCDWLSQISDYAVITLLNYVKTTSRRRCNMLISLSSDYNVMFQLEIHVTRRKLYHRKTSVCQVMYSHFTVIAILNSFLSWDAIDYLYPLPTINSSVKISYDIYKSDLQVTFGLYGNFMCLRVLYSK